MNLDEYIAIAEKQEESLCFSRFNRKDAWELGLLMANRVRDEKLTLAVSVRLVSGFNLFQFAPEGTSINNENLMTRKFNVVRDMELSSLLYATRLQKRKQTLEGRGLDPRYYAPYGGGFPIRVSGMGVMGVVVVSGLPHLEDHAFLVESLSRFLNVSGVPHIPLDAEI